MQITKDYPPFIRRSTQDTNGRDTLRDEHGVPVSVHSLEETVQTLRDMNATEAELNTPGFIEAHAHTLDLHNLGWFDSGDEAAEYFIKITTPLGIKWE